MVLVRMNSTDISLGNLKAAALTGFYTNFTKGLKLALSLPLGTATCERSFSVIRQVQKWMRATMGKERLFSFSLLYIKSNIKRIKPEQVVDAYDEKAPQRMLLH